MPLTLRIPGTRLARVGAALALGVALPACSGSGGSSVSSGGALPATGGNTAPRAAGRVAVAFTMHWNAAAATATRRTPAYVPASARSVSVTVDGGTAQYLNSPTTTLTIDAPTGTDTFVFKTYDEQNGLGNVLSTANVTQAIVEGAANAVSATLNGVVNSTKIALSNSAPNAGVPATVNVEVSALDADGNVIVGPGDYSQPIQLSTVIPSSFERGTLSLSVATLANPSQTATLTYSGSTLTSASIVAASSGIASTSVAFAPTPTFYQFSVPVVTHRPAWVAQGSDGNMWFTESPGSAVARVTPDGVVTEFSLPTANAEPEQIVTASDGNLWFTENPATAASYSKIGKLTTTGTFTEYTTLFAPPPSENPLGIVDRGDGNVWYVTNGSSRVGFQSIANGVAGETSIPTSNSGAFGIATAPDNNLYYTESATDKIGRITNLFTAQSEISLTTGTTPESIVRGPDGNLWFTESGTNKIGRLSPSSFSVTGEFPTLTPNANPVGITVGRDGALWFTENGQDRVGRITTGGTVTEFASPVSGLGLNGIAVGPDGSLWLAESGTALNPGRFGKLVY